MWYPVAMDLATAVQSLEQAPAVQPAAPPPTVIPVEELAMYHGFIANIHNHSTPQKKRKSREYDEECLKNVKKN